ncbi:CBS domain-containing protein [Novosphingobium malaysiense]|uniref:Inosine-5-monophosphate dehydrogenase n=1 Tax=Novosphingobium malaysiense TaxID=1348853 RepID=A0A0B1ZQL2_9SPHN|nr:CBS domain-containing protein [Novosphingobium malaysiense]KHK92886.1 inosine-5-monophosphate dehydrogenase [Novosphingobium malaysiense]
MNVSQCMTSIVETIRPDQTLADAARAMEAGDYGILPVAENDRLVGMISDRDIAIRGIGCGHGPETKVSEVMSSDVLYCLSDADVDDVMANMGETQVRRMPVIDERKHMVGIVSLSDFAPSSASRTGKSLSEITRPSSKHSQSI